MHSFNVSQAQKLIPYSTITSVYTGSGNQQIDIIKLVADVKGNSYLLLKAQGNISIQRTNIADLLNSKTNAPSYQIIKLDKEGKYLWGLASNNAIADIACDSSGNLFFCANNQSDTKNSKLIFYQSKTVIMAENASNLLVKFSPDGAYLWSKKMQGDFYLPRSILRIGFDNKLYYLITKNGTRMMDHSIFCLDLNGREEWRTDIVNQGIDVFQPGFEGKTYIAGYDYKVDEKKIVVYPFEISRYVLLEINESGNPKKLFDKKFEVNKEAKQRIDYYINTILFDTSNNPLFMYCGLIGSDSPEISIANKKFRKNDGEFIMVQIDKKGDIIWSYQLKTATNLGNKQSLAEGSMGLKPVNGISYTKNCTWLACAPTATGIPYKEKRYELLGKTDLIYFELNPAGKGNIEWISTAATGKLFEPSPFISRISDSTFYISNKSNKIVEGVQGNYTDLRRLEIKIKKKPKIKEENENISKENNLETDTVTIDTSSQEKTNETPTIETNTENQPEITIDSTSTTESEITETNTDSSAQSKNETTEDVHALKVQLLPMPSGQTMLLEILKVPDDSLAASRKVEVEIRDENGNNIFPRESELHENKLQFNIDMGKWARGVYTINVTVAGKETAELKIVRI